jgi:outer membrane murein-binding lipoprotein Lpp
MRTLVLLIAAVVVASLAGCIGVAKSKTDIHNTAMQTLDMDMRQIVDDWNMIWLADRQGRQTRWQTR